jgi:K+-transporting ATPase ATPase F chain
MNFLEFLYGLSGIVSVLLLAYLVYALLCAEEF